MREYGRLATLFWTSTDIQALSDDGKILAAYGITGPHGNMAGVYRLTNGTVSDDLLWDTDRVSKGFEELHRREFATRCIHTKWMVIHKYLLWNPVKGPKQREGLVKVVKTMPRGAAISARLWEVICQYVQGLEPERLAAIKAHLDPQTDTRTLPLALGIGGVAIEGVVAVAVTGLKEGGGSSTPPPPPAGDKPSTLVVVAYASAYRKRYGVEPTLNPKVLGQFTNLVSRLGAAAAPVAAFYVEHGRKVYVDSTHCVDLLLRDAEGLHTEYQRKKFPSFELEDWWKSTRGVVEMATKLGVKFKPNDTLAMKSARVFIAAGDGPWLLKVEPVVVTFMQELRRLQEAAA